ncbi:MAG: class I tRNA ligase family protein, partial [Candidatus Omnitrophota bacterium]
MINYKDTLNLPKTSFSMKANLPQREPEILKKWDEADIYDGIIQKRKNAGKMFILHDGPPYANGHIHMGHVLNKILKDVCVKYFTMKGHLSPYIPGWDCHGLPVEHQLFKELNIGKEDISQVEFRKKAYDYAMKYVGIQSEEFKRLGVFGDWKNPYLTLTNDYEASILSVLADLYEKGYIYKDLKPVNWCKTCETALAEAEVEYEDKTSPSIYVKFKVTKFTDKLEEWAKTKLFKNNPDGRPKGDIYFVIWTTTPWTLLANVAIALNPDEEYVALWGKRGEVYIVAQKLKDNFLRIVNAKTDEYIDRIPKKFGSKGQIFEGTEYKHPFLDDELERKVVTADYVSMEDGTGCVHTAPGHGQEDRMTQKKYNLDMIMEV